MARIPLSHIWSLAALSLCSPVQADETACPQGTLQIKPTFALAGAHQDNFFTNEFITLRGNCRPGRLNVDVYNNTTRTDLLHPFVARLFAGGGDFEAGKIDGPGMLGLTPAAYPRVLPYYFRFAAADIVGARWSHDFANGMGLKLEVGTADKWLTPRDIPAYNLVARDAFLLRGEVSAPSSYGTAKAFMMNNLGGQRDAKLTRGAYDTSQMGISFQSTAFNLGASVTLKAGAEIAVQKNWDRDGFTGLYHGETVTLNAPITDATKTQLTMAYLRNPATRHSFGGVELTFNTDILPGGILTYGGGGACVDERCFPYGMAAISLTYSNQPDTPSLLPWPSPR